MRQYSQAVIKHSRSIIVSENDSTNFEKSEKNSTLLPSRLFNNFPPEKINECSSWFWQFIIYCVCA